MQFSSPPTAARHARASAGALDAAAQRAQDRRSATDEDAEFERIETDVREELRRALAGEPPAPTTRARKANAAARARLSEASASRTALVPAVQVQEPYNDDHEPAVFGDGHAGGSMQAQAEAQPHPRALQTTMSASPIPAVTPAEANAPSTSAPAQAIVASSTDVQSALPIVEVTGTTAPGAASGAVVGAVVSLPSKVIETSTRAPLARAKIKTGGLLTDEMKNDLLTFLEAPEYYIASERRWPSAAGRVTYKLTSPSRYP